METPEKTNPPTVTVVVPIYNVAPWLRDCLDSLLGQTFRDWDCVCVDDGSTDGSGAIADEYAGRDPRFTVLHRANGGLSAARNAGIDRAMERSPSRYLTFVDSDDWLAPNALEELLKGVTLGDGVAAAAFRKAPEDGGQQAVEGTVGWRAVPVGDLWLSKEVVGWTACGKLFRKDLFDGVRFPEGKLHEDVFTIHRAVFRTERAAVTAAPLYGYRQRAGSITNGQWTARRLEVVEGWADQARFFQRMGRKDLEDLSWRRLVSVFDSAKGLEHPDALERVDRYRAYLREAVARLTTPPDGAPRPAVSVVIPVHNREGCVPAAVESALAQDVPDVEVVCVDDASTDRSLVVLAVLAKRDARVRIVALPENGGTGVARKSGILAARGEYVLCLDADDRFLPGVFGRLLAEARRKGLDVMQYRCSVVPVGTAGEGMIRFFRRLLDFRLPSRPRGSWRLLRDQADAVARTHWVVWNKIYRAEPLQEAARLQEDGWMVAGEDMLLTVILQSLLPSWGRTDLCCLEYRCGEGSIRDVEMTPEIFEWKLNRADCCRALLRYESAAVDRIAPGFRSMKPRARRTAFPRQVRKTALHLQRLCFRLVYDRMEVTWKQIPRKASGVDLAGYQKRFLEAWGPALSQRFLSRAISQLHVKETPAYRLGAFLLEPVRRTQVFLRSRKAKAAAARKGGPGHA